MIDKKKFWEKKIIQWENGRYGLEKQKNDLVENLSDNLSSSLIYRQKFALDLLNNIKDKNLTILELGCGSGLIVKKIFDLGFKNYIGVDISENAILRAKKINESFRQNAKFYSSNTDFLADEKIDIVLSLGLFDWLENNEIINIFKLYPNSMHLHSISEKKKSIYQFLHKIYVHISYGYKSKGYKPKYHTLKDIKKLYTSNLSNEIKIFNHKNLKFGAFIKNYD
jgi:2-polyprenyl-3-methyl-5-hydroxy-6-metoxy-1,4-benzoquinol methylase